MEIKKLSHVCLSSKNLKKVIDFYVKILKCKVVHKFVNKNKETYGYFINVGNNTFIEFFLVDKIENSTFSAFRHLCFEVYNIDILYNRLKKTFPKIKIKIGKTDGIKQFFIKDFENNIIEFHQR